MSDEEFNQIEANGGQEGEQKKPRKTNLFDLNEIEEDETVRALEGDVIVDF